MGDEQLPRDVARPDSHHGELDYPAADVVGQGPTVHKYAAKLVHSRLTYNFHNFLILVHCANLANLQGRGSWVGLTPKILKPVKTIRRSRGDRRVSTDY